MVFTDEKDSQLKVVRHHGVAVAQLVGKKKVGVCWRFDPWGSSLHGKASLGKIVNPELLSNARVWTGVNG